MSFAGLHQFNENLRTMMESATFKKADEAARLTMGYRLLNSKYGKGRWFGFGSVAPLKPEVKP